MGMRTWPGGRLTLRLLPLCGGRTAGKFADDIPTMTAQAICLGFLRLSEDDVLFLEKASKIELCIFDAKDHPKYEEPCELVMKQQLPLPGAEDGSVGPDPLTAPAPDAMGNLA